MIGKDLSQLLLDDILIVEQCVHLSLELVHLLAHRDMCSCVSSQNTSNLILRS